MTQDEARRQVVDYWMHKAKEALESARSEMLAGRLDFAVNRAYYACFYAASAKLLRMGKKFVKHAGLRAAIHQELVKAGKLDVKWGKVFDRISENRQSADYVEMWEFTSDQVEMIVRDAEGFVQEMRHILAE
jgi:uncharacterized protein (UPF0332 family)